MAPQAPATAAAPPPVDPRALFDEALRAELNGDALEGRDRWIRLAAQAPDTPQGRYAMRAAGGGDAMTLFATLGVLSAVAIPAFMKYQDRAKTSEATVTVQRLYHGAVAFYTSERPSQEAVVPPARFPLRTELTPARSACIGTSQVPHSPDPTLWEAQGWKELGFAMDDPSLYQYQFIAEGEGAEARFTVRALGDLDCDGIFSTFEQTGTIDADGNVTNGAGLFIKDELE